MKLSVSAVKFHMQDRAQGVLVLLKRITLAARIRATMVAPSGIKEALSLVPALETTPAVSTLSLTVNGAP